MILIFTSLNDPHSDAIANALYREGVDFVRINSEDLITGKIQFSFDFIGKTPSLNIKYSTRNWLLDDLKYIIYRRPMKSETHSLDVVDRLNINELWSGFHSALFAFFNAKWIGHPYLDKIRSPKIFQYNSIANSKFEIKFPPTIVSNNKWEIKKFIKQYDFVILKPIDSRGVVIEGKWVPFFSEKIDSQKLKNFIDSENLDVGLTAYYFQKYIEKKYEWRITVVGDEFFPCRIHSQTNVETETDWRKADYNLIEHEVCEIPDQVRDFCFGFLDANNAIFGAFDFIETPLGDYYFLECNFNGQWLWIEEVTGLPITSGFLKLLKNDQL